MPQFVCPTCGARLYSASPLAKCAWCGTSLSSEFAPGDPDVVDTDEQSDDD
jgi:tRNA(Ile2) C34 agmatinyltransferase TiaS